VGQPTFGIDADMGLHTDIPLIAFGGLVYLGVTLSTLVFGGARGLNDGGIDQRALFHHDASFKKPLVDDVAGVVPLLHAQHGVEWIGATTVARFGADRFDETEHAGAWEQGVHASQTYLFADFSAFTIELAICEGDSY
jgi:hypothetical protein